MAFTLRPEGYAVMSVSQDGHEPVDRIYVRKSSPPTQLDYFLGCHILSDRAAFFQPLHDCFSSCAILSDAAMFF
jgi:hypothetical protein